MLSGKGWVHKASYHLVIVFVTIITSIRVVELKSPWESIFLNSLMRKTEPERGSDSSKVTQQVS